MNCRTVIALCVALGALSATPAFANLVTNGGFETENLDPSGNPIPPPPGWLISGNGIGIDTVFPNTGTYDISFGATSSDPNPGTLSQGVATVAGEGYDLSFALLDESGLSTNTFTVGFGSFLTTITGDLAASYTRELLQVPGADAVGPTTMLTFTGLNDTSAWNLDDVSVSATAIPEPPTGLLLGSMLLVAILSSAGFGRHQRTGATDKG
jgi:hypothetical protein